MSSDSPSPSAPDAESAVSAKIDELERQEAVTLAGPYYSTPDGANPIAPALWTRIDDESVTEVLDQLRDNLSPNGHEPDERFELEEVFVVSASERQALAEVAGSVAVRQVVGLMRDAEAATDNASLPGPEASGA